MSRYQQFKDRFIRDHILIEQVKAGQVNEWAAFLKEIDRELRHRLQNAELTQYKRTRLEKQLIEIDAVLKGLFDKHWEHLSGNLTDIAEITATQTVTALEAVGVGSVMPTSAQLSAAILTAPLMINGSDAGAFIDDFAQDWTKTERKRVIGTIRQGYAMGQTNAEILQRIRGTRESGYKDGILAQTDRHLKTMIRTSIAHVAAQASQQASIASGVEKEEWNSTLDSRTSLICQVLDGEIFPIGKGKQPPAHLNCRSRRIPYIEGLDFLNEGATRASEFGPVPAKERYYDFLKRQPPEYQNRVLGKGRAEIFRNGGLTTEQFRKLQLDKNFKPISIAKLQAEVSITHKPSIKFESLVKDLPVIGQKNVAYLRKYAQDKNWVRIRTDGPETWGIIDEEKGFQWRMKIKAEDSSTDGLKGGSRQPRVTTRLDVGEFINPFTGKKGTRSQVGHTRLNKDYE